MNVLIIEPCFFGLGYLRAARQMGLNCVILTSDATYPDLHGYRDLAQKIIVSPVVDIAVMVHSLKVAGLDSVIHAVVAGNQFVTVVAAGLAAQLGLKGVTTESAEMGVHKDLARAAYKLASAPSLKYELVSSKADARVAAARIGYPVVVKPTSAASSKGVTLVADESALEQAYAELGQMNFGMFGFVHRSELLLEEFADGSEYSVELALNDGMTKFAGVTEKWVTKPPFFVELGHVFPARLPEEQRQLLIDAALAAVRALGLSNGVFHIELKWTSTGARIIETNPRPGGDHITTDLVPLATGVNLFQFQLQNLIYPEVEVRPLRAGAAAVGFVVAERTGIFEGLDGWQAIQQNKNVVRCGLEKITGEAIRPPESSADRIGFVIVEGQTADQAVQQLQAALAEITVRYR